jgi:hypothetical protein
MSLFVDVQFVNSISHVVRNFKKKADYLWNFSCPICGDSHKNKLKARGYVFRWKDGLRFKCHDNGCTCSFGDLLRTIDEDTHRDYLRATFKEREPPPGPAAKLKVNEAPASTALIGEASIASLPADHDAKKYLEGRMIPKPFFNQLLWTEDFSSLAAKVCPTHQFALRKERRIVIPFLDADRRLLAVQGRSLEPNADIRYITIKAFEEAPRIYGLDRLKTGCESIYIVEGPFDSMFIVGCLAMAGSDIPPSLPIEKVIVAYDNEPESGRAKWYE